MELNEYQRLALRTAVYPKEIGLIYVALKLAGEAGEVSEKIGKAFRNESLRVAPSLDGNTVEILGAYEIRDELLKEVGDVLWYCAAISSELGSSLEEVAQRNIDKLASRSMRNVLIGEGDNR